MTNLERGIFEPRIDKIPAFDVADEHESAEEGSRLPLLIVIALVVLAAFAGVVWLAYTQGVERGRADGPRVVAAGGGLAKAAESQPPFVGLKIYQAPSGTSSSGRPHTINKTNDVPALRPSANSVADAIDERPADSSASAPTPTSPAGASAQAPAPVSPRVATKAPAQLAAPRDVASPSPRMAAETTAPQAIPLRGVLLQIGSYKSEAEANQSWRAFKARHAIVAGYQSGVSEVNLGVKGIWYRLRIGSFADRQSAIGICERLRADGASCLIAR